MTSIKHWPSEMRPSERLTSQPPGALSIPELLAILIGSGNVQGNAAELGFRLFDHFHCNLDTLARASVTDLMKIKGIGKAKAPAIVAAFALGRETKKEPLPARYYVNSSSDSVRYLRPLLRSYDEPGFGILCLGHAGWIKSAGIFTLQSIHSRMPSAKLLLEKALEDLAVSVVTFRIHPTPNPTELRLETVEIRDFEKVARIMDIKLMDHLMINKESHVSFLTKGLIS